MPSGGGGIPAVPQHENQQAAEASLPINNMLDYPVGDNAFAASEMKCSAEWYPGSMVTSLFNICDPSSFYEKLQMTDLYLRCVNSA
jgi:hypothetical protein